MILSYFVQNDDKYRISRTVHGWTEEYCRYLDCLTTAGMSCVATWRQHSRYENSFVLGVNDRPHLGPMTKRDDFPQAARKLATLQRERGRVIPYIPKHERERQRPFDEKLRSGLEWQSWNWSQASSSSSTDLWQPGKWHEPQQ